MILFNNNSLFKSRIIWILFESFKTWTWNFKSQFEKFASFFPTAKVSSQKSFFSWSMIFKSRMGMEAHRIYKGKACGKLILPNYLNNYSISTYLGIVANSKLKLLNVQTRVFGCFLFKTGTVTECAHFKENPAKQCQPKSKCHHQDSPQQKQEEPTIRGRKLSMGTDDIFFSQLALWQLT